MREPRVVTSDIRRHLGLLALLLMGRNNRETVSSLSEIERKKRNLRSMSYLVST